jgi:hypothetical protein
MPDEKPDPAITKMTPEQQDRHRKGVLAMLMNLNANPITDAQELIHVLVMTLTIATKGVRAVEEDVVEALKHKLATTPNTWSRDVWEQERDNGKKARRMAIQSMRDHGKGVEDGEIHVMPMPRSGF